MDTNRKSFRSTYKKKKNAAVYRIRRMQGIALSAVITCGILVSNSSEAALALGVQSDVVDDMINAAQNEESGDTEHARGIIYNCNECEMYKDYQQSEMEAVLPSGYQVYVLARIQRMDGSVVYKIHTSMDGNDHVGYVMPEYVLCIDYELMATIEVLTEEGEGICSGYNSERMDDTVSVSEDELSLYGASDFEASISGFPESYKSYLRTLHASHSSWVFIPQKTDIDWNTFIENEMSQARNLVPRSMPDSYKGKQSWAYDSSTGEYIGLSGYNWVQASEIAVKYYADPRNFLTEEGIFQFELLTYNSDSQTENGVENILQNTFMSYSDLSGEGITYSQAFCKIGAAKNVSPYMLAARVRQEQGASGSSPLISGTYPGYEGYYNFFNIQAAGNTETEIYVNGLSYAKQKDWSSRYRSIEGGASVLTERYISRGQDTLYLQKFDVDSSYDGLFVHQYMQNLLGALNESKSVRNTYNNIGILENSFVFKIPVYNNMPAAACVEPDADVNTAEVEAFVRRLYVNMMDRTPDEGGVVYWSQGIVSKRFSAATVVQNFVVSAEFTRKNLSDEEYLNRLYLTLMNRNADEGGRDYWLNRLNAGSSRNYVLSCFVESKEFMNICRAYGVMKGNVSLSENRDKYDGAARYVYRLYNQALGRNAEVSGLNYWAGRIGNKQSSPYDVAAAFIFSNEFTSHNYSNEEYVRILYTTFLGRQADESGLYYWIQQLEHGSSREAVLKNFMGAKEFQTIVNAYGI